MLYFLLYFLLLLVTFAVLTKYYKNVDRWIAILFSLLFTFLGTIRWKTGGDWYFYYRFFDYARRFSIDEVMHLKVSFEPLFTAFYFFAKYTLGSYVVVQFLQIAVLTCVKFKAFERYTPYLLLAIFLNYCFFLDMITVRNYLAAGVAFYSIKYVEDRRVWKFLLGMLIAVNIHISTILFLLAYPLYHIRYSISAKVIALLLSIAIGAMELFSKLLTFSGSLLAPLGRIGQKLQEYDQFQMNEKLPETSLVTILLGILKRAITLPLIFYYEVTEFKDDKRYKGFSNLLILGHIIYFLVGNDLRIFQRLAVPFYIFEIPILIFIYAQTRYKMLFFTFLAAYGLAKLIFAVAGNNWINPFISIFNYDAIQPYWDRFNPGKPFPD